MKHNDLIKILFASLLILLITSTSVLADENYEEVSYDQLLDQLSRKKKQVFSTGNDPFDSVTLHAGFGLIGSVGSQEVAGSTSYKYQNGFQLAFGIDLFSPNWATEGAIRNFGTATSGSERRSIKEFDLKLLHKDRLSGKMGYRMGGGVGTRYLKISDSHRGVSINESTPTAIFFGGVDGYVSKTLSIGVELGARTAMVSDSADKNSLDATIRMDTYF